MIERTGTLTGDSMGALESMAFGSREAVLQALAGAARDMGYQAQSRPAPDGWDLVQFRVGLEQAKVYVQQIEPGVSTISAESSPWGATRHEALTVASMARTSLNNAQFDSWLAATGSSLGEAAPCAGVSLGGSVGGDLDATFPSGTTVLLGIGPHGMLIGSTAERMLIAPADLQELTAITAPIEGIHSRQHSPMMRRKLRAQTPPDDVYIETSGSSLTIKTGRQMSSAVTRLASRIGVPAASDAVAPGEDIAGQIATLHQLHLQGALTNKEFRAAKARLLGT